MKYYEYEFDKGINDKIQIIIPSDSSKKSLRKFYI